MRKTCTAFIAILLVGTVVAVVAGVVIASVYPSKLPSLSGTPQGLTGRGNGGPALTGLEGVRVGELDASDTATTAKSVETHVTSEDLTQSSSDQARNQREAEEFGKESDTLEGLECVLDANTTLGEDGVRPCTPPYLCVPDKPNSGAGRCRHPDSLSALHKSCDPANADGCHAGLRCSKATSSCEPALLLGESCDPWDKEMCLSGLCRRKRSRNYTNTQSLTPDTGEKARRKGAIAEDAESGNENDYVCQTDVTCGQPCDFTLRLCSGCCNVCGKDGLCEQSGSLQKLVKGLLNAALLAPKQDLDYRPTGDSDVKGIEDFEGHEDEKKEEEAGDDGDISQETERDGDEEEYTEPSDVESQMHEHEGEGQPGGDAKDDEEISRETEEGEDKEEDEHPNDPGEGQAGGEFEDDEEILRKAEEREDKEEDEQPNDPGEGEAEGEIEDDEDILRETEEREVEGKEPNDLESQTREHEGKGKAGGEAEGDEENSGSPEEGEDEKESKEPNDLEGQLHKEGQAGKCCQQPGLPDEKDSQETHYKEEVSSEHKSLRNGSEDKREAGEVNIEHSVRYNESKTQTRNWSGSSTTRDEENAAGTAVEKQGESIFTIVQGDPQGSTQTQYPQPTLLPHRRQQTVNEEKQKPERSADNRGGLGRLQNKAGVQPIQEPQQQRRSSVSSPHVARTDAGKHVDATETQQPSNTQDAVRQRPQASNAYARRESTANPDAGHRQRSGGHQWQNEEDRLRQQHTHAGLLRHKQQAAQQAQHENVNPWASQLSPEERWQQQVPRPLPSASVPMLSKGGQPQRRDTGEMARPWQRDGQFWQQKRISEEEHHHQRGLPARPREWDWQTRHPPPPLTYEKQQRVQGQLESSREPVNLQQKSLRQLRQQQQQFGHRQPALKASDALHSERKHQRWLTEPRLQHSEGLTPRGGKAGYTSSVLRSQPRTEQPPPRPQNHPQSSRETAMPWRLGPEEVWKNPVIPPLPQMYRGLRSTTTRAEARPPSSLSESVDALYQARNQAVQRYMELLHAVPVQQKFTKVKSRSS